MQIAGDDNRGHRFSPYYTALFWINAETPETLLTSFTAIAHVLQLPERNEKNQDKIIRAMNHWLSERSSWLLVFDNVEDLAFLQPFLPAARQGSILLTTRLQALGTISQQIAVAPLDKEESLTLFLQRARLLKPGMLPAQLSPAEMRAAQTIVEIMEGLPLALDQAGAYLEETGCSCEDYLRLYHNHRQTLLARRGTQATNYPDSVATTWSLSFHQVEQANPAAAELLRLCAFLAPDHIPEELLTEGVLHWPSALKHAVGDLFAFNQMLEALLTFSLVKRQKDEQMLSIHRLVQAIQIDALPSEEQRQWAERAVRAMHALFPRDPKEAIATWPQCQRYLEQVQACDMLIQRYALVLPEAADLLNRAGIYLCERASYPLAEPFFQQALRLWEQLEGPEHPAVAEPLQGLAHLYRQQGKFREATPLFQRALLIWEQALGAEHPQVASVLNNLALLSYDQGKFAEAKPLFQRALHIWEQHKHPKLAYALNGLANLYYQQGKFGEAAPLYQRALSIWEQEFGPEHPLVAAPLNNLAILYKKQGEFGEAKPLYLQALRIWEHQLGPDHAQVAYALINLANLYVEQGNFGEVEPLYQRALRILEPQFGPEHPLVAHPLNGLADLHRRQSCYTTAEPLYERALRIREQLEPTHPDTAETLYGLALLREAQGRCQEAALLYQRALAIREQVYGPQHPETTKIRACFIALSQREATAPFDRDHARTGER